MINKINRITDANKNNPVNPEILSKKNQNAHQPIKPPLFKME